MLNIFDEIDFNAFYKRQRELSRYSKKSACQWDKKAKNANVSMHNGIYNDFIKSKISFEGSESFLDVGCGPGTFAIAFAHMVKNIFAFDFSPSMLQQLQENIKINNISNIKYIQSDIEGDWEDIPVCDVVLASRCFEVENLKKALINLNSHANRAVYLTLRVGKNYINNELLRLIGRESSPRPDYIYALNILYQMGIYAKVDFVPKEDEKRCLLSQEEYIKSLEWTLGDITKQEEAKLRDYFILCQDKGKIPLLRNNVWALIYWEK